MQRIIFTCLFLLSLLACTKKEITEVYEYEELEEVFDNDLISQVDTVLVTLNTENNHTHAIKNLEPTDSLSYIPKIYLSNLVGWISLPCRLYTGEDMNFLVSYRIEADSTYIYASEANPFIPDELTRECLVVWLPVY